ncbi:MAG: 2-C-methyl-D-erythritol 4-phosphate cytidylyltransferase [Peptoniphilaceae bacterium]|nr:2-C-methyl-D-erythritol 4-phosphate cytidylyltransferase [Peptoniphilaceae bacterium]MDY6018709.1 2-C-methyl-D-erythritol 4-phosphate cytidylyltransferase [Anaerococcus sp.]
MIANKKLGAVIVAAGSGQRMNMGVNKPYIEIKGKKILEITLDTITSIEEIDKIILVIRKEDQKEIEEIIKKYKADIKFVYGRQTREESTLQGLLALSDSCDLVLTHDGVRPFASRKLFKKIIEEGLKYKAVISATKAKDTIKVLNSDMTVSKTPNRDFLYQVQTPQVYDRKVLIDLYKKYQNTAYKITDDSQLFELFSDIKVKVVEGEYTNIKITTAEDLIFAKAIMEDL